MFVEGTMISPGTYTGIDGNTVEWSEDVLTVAAPTAKGRPILYAHTDEDGQEKELAVGFVSASVDDNGQTRVKGVIYNDSVFPLVEKGLFNAFSPEVDFMGEKLGENRYRATEAQYTSVTLTNMPANEDAKIDNYGFVHISLEEKTVRMEDKKIAELTSEEKLNFVREFLKEQNLPFPTKDDLDTDKPGDKPAPPIEIPDIAPLQEEIADLQNQVNYFQTRELIGIETEIREVDTEFKADAFLEGVSTFELKKTKLERHLSDLRRLIPKVRLELGEVPASLEEEKAEKKKVALEMLGPEKAKAIYPELFKEA
jgi:hypothetical protein